MGTRGQGRVSPTIMHAIGPGNPFPACHGGGDWLPLGVREERDEDVEPHITEINVRYGETDQMGVAHHSSYLLWFELGRTGLLRAVGHPYRGLEERGYLLPVVEYHCRFIKGAEYDDRVRVETDVTELKSRVVTFRYRVARGDETLASGWTRHVCVDGENHTRRFPAEVLEALAPAARSESRISGASLAGVPPTRDERP
jgi:acyl-CoA thioester hydrolase